VLKKTLGTYFVKTEEKGDGRLVACAISSTLRKHLVYPFADPSSRRPTVDRVESVKVVDPVAIGDMVRFVDAGEGHGMIVEVLQRRNKLSRRAAGPRPDEQVIAANVDQVVTVVAARQPKLKLSLLDRYLADTEAADIPAVICVTKMDLADEQSLRDEMRLYQEIGYQVIVTSTVTRKGLEECKEMLRRKDSVLIGKSGVGKTSLLNALQPGLGLRVKEVSGATGKGKHTTSHLEMFELDFEGCVVDTPGMREFGLWNSDGIELAALFPEMRSYLGKCRFRADCRHHHEPGCAIKDAVEEGSIAESRYESYLRMLR
jgi:ribosome biogenesis GTPase